LDGAREPILKSRSGYYIARLIDRADAVMPDEIHGVLGPWLHELEKELDPALPPGTPRQQHPQDGGETNKTPRTADAQPWDMFRGASTGNGVPSTETADSDSLSEPNPLHTLSRMVEEKGTPKPERTSKNLKMMKEEWHRFWFQNQPDHMTPLHTGGGKL